MLMEHVKKLNIATSSEIKWLWIGVWLLFAICTYVDHSLAFVFACLFGSYLLTILWRLGRTAITERLISQVFDEIRRGAFDETVTT